MADRDIQVLLKLKDELSGQIKAVEGNVKTATGQMATHAESLGAAFSKMASIVGVSFGAAYAASKFKQMAQDSIDLGAHIENTSRKMGLSTDTYQKLGYVLKQSGGDIDNMGRAFSTMSKLAEKSNSILGVSTHDSNGHLKEQGVLFQELLLRISDIPNPTERMAASMKIFGMAGREVFNIASQGKDRIKELADETQRYGLIIDKSVLRQLDEGHKAQVALGEAWKVSAANLTTFLIPAMQTYIPLLQKMFGSSKKEAAGEAASTWTSSTATIKTVGAQVLEYKKTIAEQDLKYDETRAHRIAELINSVTSSTGVAPEALFGVNFSSLLPNAAKAEGAKTASDKAIEAALGGGGKKGRATKEKTFDESYSWDKFYDMEPPKGVFLDLPERGWGTLPAGEDKQDKALRLSFEKKQKLAEEAAKKQKKLEEEELKRKKLSWDEQVHLYASMAEKVVQIDNNIAQVQMNNVEAEKKAQTDAVEHSSMSAKAKAKKIEEINKEAQAKEREIKKEQQGWSIAQAIISGAVGVMQGYAQYGPIVGTIMAVLTAAVTASEIAVIASQKFAEGGVVQQKVGRGETDSEPAMLTPGEVVLRPDQFAALRGGGGSTTAGHTHYHLGDINIGGNASQSTVNQIRQSQVEQIKALKRTMQQAARIRQAA